jgi:hypothetical protein
MDVDDDETIAETSYIIQFSKLKKEYKQVRKKVLIFFSKKKFKI